MWWLVTNLLTPWRHGRLEQGARLITIAAPPEVDAAGAGAFWTTLVGGLTPPGWRQRLYGTPHATFEYPGPGRQLTISVWVPGITPPGTVGGAVRAAGPGAPPPPPPATPP